MKAIPPIRRHGSRGSLTCPAAPADRQRDAVQHCRMPLRKTEVELLRYITDGGGGALAQELARWFEARPRFAAFVAAHRDKVRKKLRASTDERASTSVRAELITAYLLLADRRFEITPEAFGAGNRGPDLTMTFRASFRFNVEITHLRQGPTAAGDVTAKLSSVLLGKLRQLPPGMANLLVIAVPSPSLSEDDLVTAVRRLKSRAERADDAFFTARGFTSARNFYAHYLRLSAVCVVDTAQARAAYWPNREAKHPLPTEPARAVRRCLGADTA